MSELQKWITSISGAVVGQIAVLGFFYLLVTDFATSHLASAKPASPKEITVMLSQMVEEIRAQVPEPEEIKPAPEEKPPLEAPTPFEKQFVDTDSNTARPEAPKNARFESDRNTTASTEFLPDPNLPQELGPTLKGEKKIKYLSLANQEYAAGEIKPAPMQPPETNQAAATPPAAAEPIQALEKPKDTTTTGEADEAKPVESDLPPNHVAERLTQPKAETIGELAQLEKTISAEDGSHTDALIGEVDQKAIATKVTEEHGEPAAPEEKKEIKATPVISEPPVDKMKEDQSLTDAQIQKQLDESMLNPAFLAHRRKNKQNGSILSIGEGSVDAESTETGKYKKAVQQAISQKWHEYREDKAADVTWGILVLHFNITPSGRLQNLKIVKKEATELVTEFSLRAIVDAKIPRMPSDVASALGPEGLEMHYNIIIY